MKKVSYKDQGERSDIFYPEIIEQDDGQLRWAEV